MHDRYIKGVGFMNTPPFLSPFFTRIMKYQRQVKLVIFVFLSVAVCLSSVFCDSNCHCEEVPPFDGGSSNDELSSMLVALKNNPSDGKICNGIGFYYYERGEYNLAKEYYKKAIKLNKEYPVSYNNLGVVYLNENELESALVYFERAIELKPKYVRAICNLAVTRLKMGDYSEAKKLYYKAKSINPKYLKERASQFENKK